MKKIVVALDINIQDEDRAGFSTKSAVEKARYMASCIEPTYLFLHEQFKGALIQFVFREYGVTEGCETSKLVESKKDACASRFVSHENAAECSKIFSELAQKYSHLIVIGGIATYELMDRKTFINEQLPSLLAAYAEHSEICEEELKSHLKIEHQMAQHLQKVKDVATSTSKDDVLVVRNICFGWQGKKIFEHHKTTPFRETEEKNRKELSNAVFAPGYAITNNSIFTFIHPDSREPEQVLVQLCREHDVADKITKYKVDQLAVKPSIHFILSYGANARPDRIHGLYGIPLDGKNRPKLIATQTSIHRDDVILYRLNLLEEKSTLSSPLTALYPFENIISDILDDAIKKAAANFKQTDLTLIALKNLKKAFVASTQSITSVEMYNILEEYLNRYGKIFHQNTLFKKSAAMAIFDELHSKIQPILASAKEKYPVRKDYITYEIASETSSSHTVIRPRQSL